MEQLTPLLEKLASQLGTTVEHLWNVLLLQTKVEIMLCNLWMGIWLWGGIGIVVLAIIMLIYALKADKEGIGTFAIGVIIFTIIIVGIGYYVNYSDWITLTQNPQYWALKEVLSALK
jgi:hypothetical protein